MSRMVGLLVALAVFAAGSSASAAVFFTDGFDYADGELTVNDGTGDDVSGGLWVPHSGETFDDNIDVVSGQAELLVSGSEDANRSTGSTMGAGDKWYYAAIVTVNDTNAGEPSLGNNDYFMHFRDGGFGFRGRAYLATANVDASKFTFGHSASSGGLVGKWADDLDFGVPHTIVVSYDYDTGFSEMWVNPTSEADTKLTDTAGEMTAVAELAMRQDFTGGTPDSQTLVDIVSIGTTFDEVLRAVPEPASFALVGIGALTLIARRRAG